MDTERILIVDDEPLLLELYVSQLGGEFAITTATSGDDALRLLPGGDAYALIIADMHMPGMSGVEFLRSAQELSPHSLRIMVTADNDQGVAVQAVNSGSVFRFMNKPCTAEQIAAAIRAGLDQYRLRNAETQMLASTVTGSINLMGEVLALVSPVAFGKANRVTRIVEELCRRLTVADAWELSMAAMLSQLGCISLPDALIPRAALGERLSPSDDELWRSHPRLGHDLISKIPRLERVADIVLLQQEDYRPASREDVGESHTVEWRAGCLRAALEFDARIERQDAPLNALEQLRNSTSRFPAAVLDTLESVILETSRQTVRMVTLPELRAGMILDENLVDAAGRVLLTKGQEIAEWLITRLQRLGLEASIRQPIRIVDPVAQLELPPPSTVTGVTSGAFAGRSLVGAA
jgi:response regulator RpfG family c-di-GMP phosphodiesterase